MDSRVNTGQGFGSSGQHSVAEPAVLRSRQVSSGSRGRGFPLRGAPRLRLADPHQEAMSRPAELPRCDGGSS